MTTPPALSSPIHACNAIMARNHGVPLQQEVNPDAVRIERFSAALTPGLQALSKALTTHIAACIG